MYCKTFAEKKPTIIERFIKGPLLPKAILASVFIGVGGLLLGPQGPLNANPANAATPVVQKKETTLIDSFINGGPLMWPILAATIIGLTAVISRMHALRSMNHTDPNKLRQALIERLSTNEIKSATRLCMKSKSAIASIYQAGISRFGKQSVSDILAYMEKTFFDKLQIEELRYRGVIGTSGNIAALLGAIGTLSGIQYIFSHDLSQANHLQGLDQAIITSIFGYTVAALLQVAKHTTNSNSRELEGQIVLAIDEFNYEISQLPPYTETETEAAPQDKQEH